MARAARPRVILVVDDELDVALPLAELLERFIPATTVYAAQGVQEALMLLSRDQVDLVITDLRMPGLDGEHLLGVLRAMQGGPTSILMTGFPEAGTVHRCLALGGVGAVVTKPFDAAVMADTARRLLEERARGRAA